MRYFCTYFDRHYLTRGMALYQSLRRHCSEFQLWILCMDNACHDALQQLALPNMRLISLAEFEADDRELQRVKPTRSLVEYYFTCTPSLPLYILQHWPDVDLITYLDSDLFFFANPAPIYDEFNEHSIAIIPHRFSPHLRHMERNGIYNVGWLSFRRDPQGLACLQWWRQRCIEWCYDIVEQDRYADQKYLNDWPQRFPAVAILQHKGANLAPWNVRNYSLRTEGTRIWVDDQLLLFYHFQGLKRVSGCLYDTNVAGYDVQLDPVMRRYIYVPYIRCLLKTASEIAPFYRNSNRGKSIRKPKRLASLPEQVLKKIKRTVRVLKAFQEHNYVFAINGRVF